MGRMLPGDGDPTEDLDGAMHDLESHCWRRLCRRSRDRGLRVVGVVNRPRPIEEGAAQCVRPPVALGADVLNRLEGPTGVPYCSRNRA